MKNSLVIKRCSCQFLRSKRLLNGFTLVELLIVIVVIAILAAIAINVYSGTQQKARNSQTITAAQAYQKGYLSYAIEKGNYPSATIYCLGTGYAPANQCWDNRTYTANTSVNTALKEYMGQNLPDPSTMRIFYNSTDGSRAGILSVGTGTIRLEYYLEGRDTKCGGSATYYLHSQAAGPRCRISLPDPSTL